MNLNITYIFLDYNHSKITIGIIFTDPIDLFCSLSVQIPLFVTILKLKLKEGSTVNTEV